MYGRRRRVPAGGFLASTVFIGLMSLVLAMAVFGFLFDYDLAVYADKDIPWYGDCVAGTLTAPLTVSAAVVGYVLVQCDVPEPIFFPPDTDN
jgi:hypothetical protein